MAGEPCERAVAHAVGDDVVYLLLGVAEVGERGRHRLVDDLEVAAAGQLLELDEGEVGLDAGGVAVHDEADCACRRDHRDLGVAVAGLLALFQRLVPGLFGCCQQSGRGSWRERCRRA